MKHKRARYIDENGDVQVIEADEVQNLVNKESSDRNLVVKTLGPLSLDNGSLVSWVREYERADCTEVSCHFKMMPIKEDEETFLNDALGCLGGGGNSDEYLHALRLLRDNFGRWTVAQWCCPKRKRSVGFSFDAGSFAKLYYKHSNGVAPLAVLNREQEPVLLVYMGSSIKPGSSVGYPWRGVCHRLLVNVHTLLSPSNSSNSNSQIRRSN